MADTANINERGADEEPRYLQRISLRTALFVAAVFNAILGVTFALVGYAVLVVAVQRGAIDQINKTLADLSNDHPLHVSATRIGVVWTLIVVAWTVAMTIVAFLAVVVFNTVLRVSGGVELDLRDARGRTFDLAVHAGRVQRRLEVSARWTAAAAYTTAQWTAAAARATAEWIAAAARTAAQWIAAAARTAAPWAAAAARAASSRIRVPALRLDTGATVLGVRPRGPRRPPPRPNAGTGDEKERRATSGSDPAPPRTS
jgi:hypothetical protein